MSSTWIGVYVFFVLFFSVITIIIFIFIYFIIFFSSPGNYFGYNSYNYHLAISLGH